LLLINVWASYCGPCVTELPEFVTMNRMYRRRNFEMITISIDDPEKEDDVLKILKEKKVAVTNFIVTVPKRDRFADLLDKEWQGPLPHTLLIDPEGKIIYRKTGAIEPLEVRRKIVDFLGRTYATKGK
jgi:thiol-disulfide isomerase/thioredoxin